MSCVILSALSTTLLITAPAARAAPEPIAAAPSDAPPPEVTPDPDAPAASDDDPPAPTQCPEPPKCDCEDSKSEEGAPEGEPVEEDLDATEFSIGAGFTLNTGNTNNYTGNTVAKFRVRRGIHQSTTSFLANVGSASADRDEIQAVNVSNQQLRSGYDVLLPKRFSVFAQAQWRRDTFQGLDTRININPGAGYYFLDREKHRLWTQVGYGYQYDVRTKFRTYDADDNGEIFLDDGGQPTVILDRYVSDHQARIFLATDNQFNEHVGAERLRRVSAELPARNRLHSQRRVWCDSPSAAGTVDQPELHPALRERAPAPCHAARHQHHLQPGLQVRREHRDQVDPYGATTRGVTCVDGAGEGLGKTGPTPRNPGRRAERPRPRGRLPPRRSRVRT